MDDHFESADKLPELITDNTALKLILSRFEKYRRLDKRGIFNFEANLNLS